MTEARQEAGGREEAGGRPEAPIPEGAEPSTAAEFDAAGPAPAASAVPGPGGGGGRDGAGGPSETPERVVDAQVLHRGRYLEYRVLTIERADGSRGTRDIVGHPGAVAIVAVDDAERVLLVRQFRLAVGGTLLEIPAGTLDLDEATGQVEDRDAAAARELEEETGYRAGRLERLGEFWTAPGFATELMTLYLATELRAADENRLGPDDDEHLELARVPWREAVAAAERGEIRDAKSIVGLLRLARLREAAEPAPEPDREPGDARLVDVRYPLTLADYVRANVVLATTSTGNRVFAGLMAAAGAFLLVAGDVVFGLFAIVLATVIVTGLVGLPFLLYQVARRRELFEATTRLAADEQGLRFSSPFASGVYPWAAFARARERGGFVFLDSGAGPNLFVPLARLPAADGERLRTLIAIHLRRTGR